MEQLIITADLEEYTIGLNGQLKLNEFSGFGEAWFNFSEVTTFCKKLSELSQNMNGSVELIGYQSKPDGSEYLETFSLKCKVLSPSKLNGIVGIQVVLADCPGSDCRQEEIRTVSGELKVRNHKLNEFSANLLNLLENSVQEVSLLGGASI